MAIVLNNALVLLIFVVRILTSSDALGIESNHFCSASDSISSVINYVWWSFNELLGEYAIGIWNVSHPLLLYTIHVLNNN